MSDSGLLVSRLAQGSSLIVTKSGNPGKTQKHNPRMRIESQNKIYAICKLTGTTCFECPLTDCKAGAKTEP